MSDVTDYEAQQVEQANAAKLTPVVFIHGLWLLPSSWDRWRAVFEEAGYATLAPGWPDDPSTVEDANKHPEVLARKSVGQIADHLPRPRAAAYHRRRDGPHRPVGRRQRLLQEAEAQPRRHRDR